MPPSKRDASNSNTYIPEGGVVTKKQRTASTGQDGQHHHEEQTTTTVAAAAVLSPVAKPDAIPSTSSVKVKVEDDEPPMSNDHRVLLGHLDFIKTDPDRVHVVEGVFGLMMRMVRSNQQEDLMKYIIDANGISMIAAIVKKHASEKGLQKEGWALLDLFFETVAAKASKGGIEAVLDVMKVLAEEVEVQKKCCHVLCTSAGQNGVSKIIAQAGGCDQILAALGAMKGKPDEEGEKAIKTILTLMTTLPDDIPLQAKCCGILWVAAKSGLSNLIGEAGGVPCILNALKKHPSEEYVLEQGLGAFVVLTHYCASNRTKVVDADGIALVIDTLKCYPNNAKVQYGVGVLRKLNRKHCNVQSRPCQNANQGCWWDHCYCQCDDALPERSRTPKRRLRGALAPFDRWK